MIIVEAYMSLSECVSVCILYALIRLVCDIRGLLMCALFGNSDVL